jgi:ectoine hydroxylase-related dioxygenase (phytanoyl-CoA dioxygenase family)
VLACGISIKDRHREDNTHTDHVNDALKDTKLIKLLGVLNADWDCTKDGGGFTHGEETFPLEPGDFLLFDPRIPHRADNILSDKKRIAIDFTLRTQ